MLKFHRTSILESNAQTVVNTVNTVGVMGKGLAAAYKERFPEMFEEYAKICKRGDLGPGSLWLWKGPDQWVLNFATKKHWRYPSKILYVQNGLQEFRRNFEAYGIREIAFPRLGCGNGGLKWTDVQPLMAQYLSDLPISIYIHDFEKPIIHREHERIDASLKSAENYFEFLDDLKKMIELKNGEVRALGVTKKFRATMTDNIELLCLSSLNQVIATEEDLFKVWTRLMDSPVSRFDLSEEAQKHALKFFSILSILQYIRPINIKSLKGQNRLAIELMDSRKSEKVENFSNTIQQS